jgi:membrane protein implicated in regulation of membrane protease activity
MSLLRTLNRVWIAIFGRGREHESLDDDLNAFDEAVTIVAVDENDRRRGRILWRGTTWLAQNLDQDMVVNTKARIVARDNLCLIIRSDESDILE